MKKKICATAEMQRLQQKRRATIAAFAAGKILSGEAIRLCRTYDDLIAKEEARHRKAAKNFKASSKGWRKAVRHEV